MKGAPSADQPAAGRLLMEEKSSAVLFARRDTFMPDFSVLSHYLGWYFYVMVALLAAVVHGPKPAAAEMITADIQILGAVNFVTDISDNTLGAITPISATQTGGIGLRSGGVLSTSTLNGRPITGPATRSGPITDIGDGLSMDFDISTNSTNNTDGLGGIFGAYEFVVTNHSDEDAYFVTFQVQYTQHSEANGADSYVDNWFYFYEGTSLPGIALVESEPNADTLNDPPGPGPFDVADTEMVQVTIEPQQILTFSGIQEIFTEAFKSGPSQSDSDASSASSITIAEVVITPEPTTALIFLPCLLLLAARRKTAMDRR